MTIVSASGPSTIESWMVSKLFNAADQAQSDNQPTTSAATSIATVAASGSSNLSSATAQALTTLKTGGDVPASAPSPAVERPLMSVAQGSAAIKANNALTSDQVNAALYGSGLPPASGFSDSPNITFADFLATGRKDVVDMRAYAASPEISDADRQAILDTAQQDETNLNSIEAAYANHTVVFQKSSDVAGLGYSGIQTLSNDSGPGGTDDPNLPPTKETNNITAYNQDFLANRNDNMNHLFFDSGFGVDVYATWQK